MSCHIQFEVLTNDIRVALEFFIDTGKDTLNALASVIVTHLRIHQIPRKPSMRSRFATRHDFLTLEEGFIIEIEIPIRVDIR
jgi:hypothetical protein